MLDDIIRQLANLQRRIDGLVMPEVGALIQSELVQTIPNPLDPLINGTFLIWQRGTSFVSPASGAYTADRWAYYKVGAAVHTVSRSTDVPTVAQAGILIPYSALIDCTTVDSSIAAGDYTFYEQRMEGYNWLYLAQRQFTVSFWTKATKTGIYCFSIRNSVADRSYVAEYTINAADTWEYKTITIPASPSAGTWNYTNSVGAFFTWALACGSTLQTTAGTWQTGNYITTANQVNATDSTANNFYLTGVNVAPGAAAAVLTIPDYGSELIRCMRYYELQGGAVNSIYFINTASGVEDFYANAFWQVEKRAIPTVSFLGTWATNNLSAGPSLFASSLDRFTIKSTSAGAGSWHYYIDSTDDYIEANAEL